MRRREATPQVLIEAPPAELRMFSDPSRAGGRGSGMDAFPDRAAWLAARAEWAREHGLTVVQWWEELADDAASHARTLDELNLPFGRDHLVETDDWEDPRLAV